MGCKAGALAALEREVFAACGELVRCGLPCYGKALLPAFGRRGTLYRILASLEEQGHLAGVWEDAAIAEREKRPRRRYYRIACDSPECTGAGGEAEER